MPIESDLRIGSDGKYYAEVDGCRWDEFGRFPDSTSPGTETVGMQTPCLPYELLHYNTTTGEIQYLIQ